MNQLVTEKIIVPVEQCAPGMILMQPIIDEQTGSVIVAKGQTLSEENLKRLENFKHTQIWIKIVPEAQLWEISERTYQEYKDYAAMLRNIFGVKSERTIDLDLLKRIANNIVEAFDKEYNLLACVNLLPKVEKDIYQHSVNVAFLSLLVGRWLNFPKHRQEQLVLAALLHDVGKMKINQKLCDKQQKAMDVKERLEYKRHAIYGYEILALYENLDIEVLKGILCHHERMDGSGYPLSLKDDQINDYAKIIGLVDTYDHLKEDYHAFEVIRILSRSRVREFEVNMLLRFCYNLANYYIGAKVILTTGEIGEVKMIQPHAIYRPIIETANDIINLNEQTHIQIIGII